jgi:hypothetical protein
LKWLGDSFAQLVVNRLTGFPDFSVVGPRRAKRAKLIVEGAVTVSGSTMLVSLRLPPRSSFGIPSTVRDVEAAATISRQPPGHVRATLDSSCGACDASQSAIEGVLTAEKLLPKPSG